MEPETPPAERALRTAPVRKESPAAREQGLRAQCKNPEGWARNRVTVLICLCPHLPKSSNITGPEKYHGVQDCTSSTTGRGTDRERCKEGASVGGTGRRSARSAQPGNPREPGLLEIARDSRSGKGQPYRFFYLTFENDNCSRAWWVLQDGAGAWRQDKNLHATRARSLLGRGLLVNKML